MKTISFKDFKKDYREYYNDKKKCFKISTYSEMEEILFDLYNTDKFEIDYEHEMIELY